MQLAETLQLGRHEPFGATVRDGGVNFAVFSDHAMRIELCIFDERGEQEIRRYDLHGPHDGIFQGFLPQAAAGLIYGLRAHGTYEPAQGHRFNANKLLLDPCAREIIGHFSWRDEHHGYVLQHADGSNSFDPRDNAGHALKARVPAALEKINRANAPRIPASDVVLYEMHVKGFSKTREDIPANIRGTYAALAHPAAIAHFKSLGVTTLSLLPVHYCLDEPHLAKLGMTNYWGYNTLGFFAPSPRLSCTPTDPTAVRAEFRDMVTTLHQHGLEVVLDVVYNHTPEGNDFGPTLSFRGLDNASWYHLRPDDKSLCENFSGCGNALNVSNPRVAQFVLDSLRFWVEEMGVDGFRFDLAPVLGRIRHGYDSHAPFFTALRQDPILSTVHLIAEPWDSGHNGYQLGHFPGRFLEWNDKFRDAVRGYWLHNTVSRGDFARRFMASNDVFHHGQRRPTASINFVSVHDGFTLADTVSYDQKHNHKNGEDNRDGRDNELCENFGVEGQTDNAVINAIRSRVQRAMLATLIFAQGTPMLCAGDEISNSQQGNNNAYCQDNETGWLDWANANHALRDFVSAALKLRREHSLLHHDHWFASSANQPTVNWFKPDGEPMQINDWHHATEHAFFCLLSQPVEKNSALQKNIGADKILICFNPSLQSQDFILPSTNWQLAFDSSGDKQNDLHINTGNALKLPQKTLALFTLTI
jgi:isoamylase